MSDNLALKLADHHVRAFADEASHRINLAPASSDVHDCEDFLQQGIVAFRWLRQAEETMREADERGLFDLTSEIQDTLDALYVAWQSRAELAERWVDSLATAGGIPSNFAEFRMVCDAAREVVEHRNWRRGASIARTLSLSSEPW